MSDRHSEIDKLLRMNSSQLRNEWTRRFDGPAPPVQNEELLRRWLAQRIQEDGEAGLPLATSRRLLSLAESFDNSPGREVPGTLCLRPGTVLAREWKGVRHRVRVQRDGFEYAGRHYRSLSEIARAITKTRWSGPRFFGIQP